jgi:hypothetical protein
LGTLVAAAQQDNEIATPANEVQSIPRPIIDPHLPNPIADQLHVAEMAAEPNPLNASRDARMSFNVCSQLAKASVWTTFIMCIRIHARKPRKPSENKIFHFSEFRVMITAFQEIPPMPPRPSKPSTRAKDRATSRERRADKRRRREAIFDAVLAGLSYETIAADVGISAATVRREVDRVLAQRAVDAPQRYICLQMARLSKAMMAVSVAMDQGDMRSIPALLAVNGELDRYHALAARIAPHPTAAAAPAKLQKEAPKSLDSPTRPSLSQSDLNIGVAASG